MVTRDKRRKKERRTNSNRAKIRSPEARGQAESTGCGKRRAQLAQDQGMSSETQGQTHDVAEAKQMTEGIKAGATHGGKGVETA